MIPLGWVFFENHYEKRLVLNEISFLVLVYSMGFFFFLILYPVRHHALSFHNKRFFAVDRSRRRVKNGRRANPWPETYSALPGLAAERFIRRARCTVIKTNYTLCRERAPSTTDDVKRETRSGRNRSGRVDPSTATRSPPLHRP